MVRGGGGDQRRGGDVEALGVKTQGVSEGRSFRSGTSSRAGL